MINPIIKEIEILENKKDTNRIYKVVLTGGPCGGKTTGQVSDILHNNYLLLH